MIQVISCDEICDILQCSFFRHSDIATALGVHQSTVSRRLSDGLELLRVRLRKAGFVVPLAVLISGIASQSAVAAPAALVSSLCKISLAGIGTAKVAGTSQIAWMASIAKGTLAAFFLPVVA